LHRAIEVSQSQRPYCYNNGQVAQVSYHLNRAMDNGLTQTEAAEAVTQLAFYASWPNAFSALPVMKDVFEKRNH
jgi:4-carboxymuconolactone decarboxylase